MKSEELHNKIREIALTEEIQNKINFLGSLLEDRPQGYAYEMRETFFYKYLAAATRVVAPRQVVEMGADHGASTLAFLTGIPKESHLYSIDIRDGWEFIPKDITRLTKVVGNYMDLGFWPNDLNLKETGLWFIDGEHAQDHVKEQFTLYTPFFSKGAVILLDDVISSYRDFFDTIELDKYLCDGVHGGGFGIVTI